MLLQFISQLIPVLVAGTIAYLIYYFSAVLKNGGAGVFQGFKWLLEVTPALNTFLVFITKATFLVSLILCAFGRTSNHIILSLDILYLISLLILILYHIFKQPENSPIILA
jgi:dolichol kinase